MAIRLPIDVATRVSPELSEFIETLVGLGALDPDVDDILLGEIDNLIQRYGATAAAENFVRFE